eukprot:c18070_g1_i1.p1 GENE.c18070_g1_i1~~c18070_g1_i1.p1  ORF type:complete len:374 (-),score=80.84 c18070_g1_i1:69-1190(-)
MAATKRNIPLVDLKANYQEIKAEVDAAIHAVLDSAYYIGGPEIAKFEAEFASYIGVTSCVGVANGTDAIFLALEAIGVGAGDEVITQANTYTATVFSISRTGATPVIVDVDPATMMIDLAAVEAAITPRTKAILPVHLYGMCCDMSALMALAESRGLRVLEDASQAHGCTWRGAKVGTFGDISAWSFYPGKNLGGYGDAGGITTKSAEVARQLKMARNMGQEKKYYHEFIGYNHRLDTLQAAVLSVRLRHLDEWNTRRVGIVAQYMTQLAGVGDLVLPGVPEGCGPVWHLFVVRTGSQMPLHDFLASTGVGVGIHYPIPIHETGAYKATLGTGSFPVATRAAKEMVSLPVHPNMSQEDVDYVIAKVKEFFSKQ